MRPLVGRYFKIHPVTWRSWISMRVELYGCVIGMLTYLLLLINCFVFYYNNFSIYHNLIIYYKNR